MRPRPPRRKRKGPKFLCGARAAWPRFGGTKPNGARSLSIPSVFGRFDAAGTPPWESRPGESRVAGRDKVDHYKFDISDLRQRKNSKQKLEAGCLPLVETPIGMRRESATGFRDRRMR